MRVHKIIFFSFLFFSSPAWPDEGTWTKELQGVLNQAGIKKDQVGIEVRNVHGDKLYFSSNPNEPFNPASTMKLLISVAALEKFGPQWKRTTLIKKNDKDLCLVGGGDPSFVYEDLFLMVEKFLRNPSFEKTAIENIMVDESYFQTSRKYADDFEGDSQRSFTAPLSSLSLNYNSVTIFVIPGKMGMRPYVFTEPRSDYFTINNQATTIASGAKNISVETKDSKNGITISVSGKIRATDQEMIVYRAVADPAIYSGMILKDFLQRAGLRVQGTVQKKSCPAGSTELVRFESKPLSQMILGMNKFSNNFIAETLLIHFGEKLTSESGLENLNRWAKEKKFPMDNVMIKNSSGLSRDNAVTPHFLWSVLSYVERDSHVSPEIFSSLPIGGLDGTLRRRFQSNSLRGNVRAKSGSLQGVVSLVGSVQTEKEGELLFAFLFDSRGKTTQEIQNLEEKLLEKIVLLGKRSANLQTF